MALPPELGFNALKQQLHSPLYIFLKMSNLHLLILFSRKIPGSIIIDSIFSGEYTIYDIIYCLVSTFNLLSKSASIMNNGSENPYKRLGSYR